MRIIVAHNRYKFAGGEDTVARNEIAMLRAHRHDVAAIEPDNSQIRTSSDSLRAAASLFGSQRSYTSMQRLIGEFRADLVHIHNWFPLLSPSVITAAVDARVPVVQTLHNFRMICANGVLYRNGRPCQQCVGKSLPLAGAAHACYRDSHVGSALVSAAFAYHRVVNTWDGVSRFIALSEFQRDLLVRGGLPRERICLKPNFVSDPGQIGPGSGDYCLFVGRLTPEKGIRTALRAWEDHNLKLRLRIVGDGPLRNEVARRAADNASIEYLGPRTSAQVAAHMANARALIFPSEWCEPFALTIIEALSHGTPVIAADMGSVPCIVRNAETGYLFEPGKAVDLARAVASLEIEEPRYTSIRSTCRALYKTRYTEAINYPILMQVYAAAMQERPAKRLTAIAPVRSSPRTEGPAPSISPGTQPTLPVANVLGMPVHAINMDQAVDTIGWALATKRKGYISLAGAHGIVQAHSHADLYDIAANAFLVLPDGMPAVWMGRFQGHSSMQRVFGPDLMLEVFRRKDFAHCRHFFYGGAEGVAQQLRHEMLARFPEARIVGSLTPPFRELAPAEEQELVAEIAQHRPDIIWVGISTPKQDRFMARYLPTLDTTLMVGVGAAFLFHTGAIHDSSAWVKRAGLQWLHRLVQEPSRLWRRYLHTVPLFAFHALLQCSGVRNYPLPCAAIEKFTSLETPAASEVNL